MMVALLGVMLLYRAATARICLALDHAAGNSLACLLFLCCLSPPSLVLQICDEVVTVDSWQCLQAPGMVCHNQGMPYAYAYAVVYKGLVVPLPQSSTMELRDTQCVDTLADTLNGWWLPTQHKSPWGTAWCS